MKKILFFSMLLITLAAMPAVAGSLTFKGGYVRPTGENDLFDLNGRTTTFDRDQLDGLYGEAGFWASANDFLDIGLTVGYYNSDTSINDLDFQLDGSPLQRTVELRIIPIEVGAQALLTGRHAPVVPYVGGGVGAYVWKYQERGDFVLDRFGPNPRIVNGLATTDNTDFGWHVEGGVRFPLTHAISILGEAKYFRVNGDIGNPENELDDLFSQSGRKLKLSQATYTGGIAFAF